MPEPQETLGARLSAMRRRARLTQAAFAAKLDVHPKTVSRWENDAQPPEGDVLDQAAKLLGVTKEWLRSGADSEQVDVGARALRATGPRVQDMLHVLTASQEIRVWRKEFELELARAGATDDEIGLAVSIVSWPSVMYLMAGDDAVARGPAEVLRRVDPLREFLKGVLARRHGITSDAPMVRAQQPHERPPSSGPWFEDSPKIILGEPEKKGRAG